jgi:3-hydroxyisobutyrate dehydrogenase-like beta-hydroxyacid dehydrogenase
VYFVGVAEAYQWAHKSGLNIEDLQKIISLSWGDSPVFRHFAATLISGNFKGGASMRNLRKDLGIVLESAKHEGTTLSLAALADDCISRAVAMGYEEYDTSVLYSLIDEIHEQPHK